MIHQTGRPVNFAKLPTVVWSHATRTIFHEAESWSCLDPLFFSRRLPTSRKTPKSPLRHGTRHKWSGLLCEWTCGMRACKWLNTQFVTDQTDPTFMTRWTDLCRNATGQRFIIITYYHNGLCVCVRGVCCVRWSIILLCGFRDNVLSWLFPNRCDILSWLHGCDVVWPEPTNITQLLARRTKAETCKKCLCRQTWYGKVTTDMVLMPSDAFIFLILLASILSWPHDNLTKRCCNFRLPAFPATAVATAIAAAVLDTLE